MKIFVAVIALVLLACSPSPVPTGVSVASISDGGILFDDPPNNRPDPNNDYEAWEAWSRQNDSLYIKYLDSTAVK